jgi:hypothetical protein
MSKSHLAFGNFDFTNTQTKILVFKIDIKTVNTMLHKNANNLISLFLKKDSIIYSQP